MLRGHKGGVTGKRSIGVGDRLDAGVDADRALGPQSLALLGAIRGRYGQFTLLWQVIGPRQLKMETLAQQRLP